MDALRTTGVILQISSRCAKVGIVNKKRGQNMNNENKNERGLPLPYQLEEISRYEKINKIVNEFNALDERERRLTGLIAEKKCCMCLDIIQPILDEKGDIEDGSHSEVLFLHSMREFIPSLCRREWIYKKRKFTSVEDYNEWWWNEIGNHLVGVRLRELESIVCSECCNGRSRNSDLDYEKIPTKIVSCEKDWLLCCEMAEIPIDGVLVPYEEENGGFSLHNESPFMLYGPILDIFSKEKEERIQLNVWPYNIDHEEDMDNMSENLE